MARWWRPKTPVKMGEIFQGFKEARQEGAARVKILIVAQEKADSERLVNLLASSPGEAKVFGLFKLSEKIPTEIMERVSEATCTLVLLKGDHLLQQQNLFLITTLSQMGEPFLLVFEGASPQEREVLLAKVKRVFLLPSSKVVFVSFDQNQGAPTLIQKILNLAPGREVALARHLTLFKEKAAHTIVRKTGWQNAFVSTMTFLSGPDMPILTLNQIKMVLKIAAIYEDELDLSRARELLAVLGGGFTFRALARGLLNFLPAPGWLLKGAMAYAGTETIGQAAIKYFESGLNQVAFTDIREIFK